MNTLIPTWETCHWKFAFLLVSAALLGGCGTAAVSQSALFKDSNPKFASLRDRVKSMVEFVAAAKGSGDGQPRAIYVQIVLSPDVGLQEVGDWYHLNDGKTAVELSFIGSAEPGKVAVVLLERAYPGGDVKTLTLAYFWEHGRWLSIFEFLAEQDKSSPAERAKWVKVLDQLQSMGVPVH